MPTSHNVSVVIVTHNDAGRLDKCLKSVSSQDFPNFEIVIVDANSTDNSIAIASRYASKIVQLNVNCLGYSRQIGVENASGRIIAFFDSDIMLPSDDWLSQAVDAFSAKENTAILWPKNIGPNNNSIAKCFFNFWQVIVEHRAINHPNTFTLGSNALYLKSAIDEAGGYDIRSHYSDDVDLGRRILAQGYSYAFFEKPIIHYTNLSLREYTQNQLWGARDFAAFGIKRLGITSIDALFEHFVLATRYMVKGVGKDKELSWLIYPALLIIRIASYSIRYLQKAIANLT